MSLELDVKAAESRGRGAASAPPAAGRQPVSRRRAARRSTIARAGVNAVFSAPAFVLLAVLSLYPMYILIRMAFSQVDAQDLLGAWPLNGLTNFVVVFSDPAFLAVTLQTLVFVAGVMVFTLVVGFVVAMLLRPATRLTGATQTMMIFVWALPPVVVGSLWKFLLASGGPINAILLAAHLEPTPVPFLSETQTSLFSIAAVTVWVGIPFAVLVLKSAILDIPVEVWDAARVDGAGLMQTIWYIILPAVRPTLYILGVLSVVGAFKGFDFIYVMTVGGPGTSSSTIPFFGYLKAFQNYQFGQAAAISVVAMIIVLVLAVAYIIAVRREER